jgi:basic membrane protein A
MPASRLLFPAASRKSLLILVTALALLGAFLLIFQLEVQSTQSATIPVGLVVTEAGINDASFNWGAYQGLIRAENDGFASTTIYTPTNSGDYANKLSDCAAVNDLCIAVGYGFATPVSSAAASYPAVNFATVDVTYDTYPANLRGLTFASDQVAYLAGTLAGLMTANDKVAAIGGWNVPTVNIFIDGYRNGAKCSNSEVTVAITYTNSFGNPGQGAQVAQQLISQGNDVIFGVAGPTGNGAILTATQSGVWAIGVDIDQYVTLFESGVVDGADKLLTSAIKGVNSAVYQTIQDQLQGNFTSGTVVYTLLNDGVGLAPYHEAESSIPESVQTQVESVRQGIIDGDINPRISCPMQVGLITEAGGLPEYSWNWNAYQGLLEAENDLGVTGTVYIPVSNDEVDAKVQQCVDEGNNLCIGVGWLTANAIQSNANNNPGKYFADIDQTFSGSTPNLRGTMFAPGEAGYLAGALAGLMTESDRVAAIGGFNFSAVNEYIFPYRTAAQCVNPNVTVPISYTYDFSNQQKAAQYAQDLMAQGSDVIFAVAGSAGDGAVLTTTQSGGWAIGVDVDQYMTTFNNGAVAGANKLLTSVMKNTNVPVYDTISDILNGDFTGGTVTYGLASGGVGLAPFHGADTSIPGVVKDRLELLRQAIIAGVVDLYEGCPSFVFMPMLLR